MAAVGRSIWSRIVVIVVLVLIAFLALFPIYWMINTALTSKEALFTSEPMLTLRPTLSGFRDLFRATPFALFYLNSILIATIAVAVALPVSYLAGYSMSRLRWPGRNVLKTVVLWTYFIPPVILMVPLYSILSGMHLINTRIGVILAFMTGSTPFCTWLLMGYLKGIPQELEDAALIDGCGRLGILQRIILPVASPGIVTAGIFAFNGAWGLYLYPLVLLSQTSKQLLSIGITQLFTGDVYPWGQIMSAGILACIVPVAVFMYSQKYVVQGLTLGAVK